MTEYSTKATRLGNGEYGCRVFRGDTLVVEGRAQGRTMIGPVFRDLLRTLDKLGGDAFTKAARTRKYRENNACAQAKHYWGGKKAKP